jgi:surfeit locus 1 family protein
MTRPPSLTSPIWLLGHLLALAAVVSFVMLGFWQLRRHDEKVDRRDAARTAQEAPRVAVEDAPDGEVRRVTATGEYLAGVEAKRLTSLDGLSGYEVLTPLVLDDGTAVVVVRGWARLEVDHLQGGVAPPGEVTVEGVLWPATVGEHEPAPLPEFVRSPDPGRFAAATGLEFSDSYLVITDQDPPIGEPLRLPDQPEASLGPHLGYAGQWFLFAAVLVVGYPLLLRRRVRPLGPSG